MTLYHIALFKAKPTTGQQELARFAQAGETMLGQVPGLLGIEFGQALEFTKALAHGYDQGAVVTLRKPQDLEVYAKHPLHDELMKLREEFFEEDMLLFDFSF